MKKIVSIEANGSVYKLDAVVDDMLVADISYKMLGTPGLNRAAPEEAHYLVAMVGQLNNKQVKIKLKKASRMTELEFIDVKEEKEDKSCETTTVELQSS